jgi:hypothetical protein
MLFGAQSLHCRVSQETAAELIELFGPDLYAMEWEGADE